MDMTALVGFLKAVDRRTIFAMVFLSVTLPLLAPIGLPMQVSPDAQSIYDALERIAKEKPGAIVLASFDYDPGSRAEVHPMAVAVLNHAFSRKMKVIVPALWPQGPSMASGLLDTLAQKYNLKYGEDYVQLPYFSGPTNGLPQVQAIMGNLLSAYPSDVKGTPTSTLPLTRRIGSAKDIDLCFTFGGGDPGIKAWVQIANGRFERKLAGGSTAVQAPEFLPYVQAGQMVGLMAGLKGAAEYEKLVGIKGLATAGMDAQSFAHLVIMLFIVVANITYLHDRWVQRQRDAQ